MFAPCRPGAPKLIARVEISSGTPAELQREHELADELLAVGIGRADRRDDRASGQKDQLPHLFERPRDRRARFAAGALILGFRPTQLVMDPLPSITLDGAERTVYFGL